MNGNFKYSLTDEQRNVLHQRLTGKQTKGLASRADVCGILQDALDSMIQGTAPQPALETPQEDLELEQSLDPIGLAPQDFSDGDIEDIVKQNRLLLNRVNRLQHIIDTGGAA